MKPCKLCASLRREVAPPNKAVFEKNVSFFEATLPGVFVRWKESDNSSVESSDVRWCSESHGKRLASTSLKIVIGLWAYLSEIWRQLERVHAPPVVAYNDDGVLH